MYTNDNDPYGNRNWQTPEEIAEQFNSPLDNIEYPPFQVTKEEIKESERNDR